MRDPSASFDPPPAPSATFTLPDADMVHAAWTDPPQGRGFPSRPDKAKTLSGAMLALGAALLLFVPISGVFFLVAGSLGLTIASGSPRSLTNNAAPPNH
jgi:hypothetical protein